MRIKWKEFTSIPNILTLIRLIAIPFMATVIMRTDGRTLPGFFLFAAIWLTDMLDGWIARRFHQITDVGKMLDPLVDKIFHITSAITLFLTGRLPTWILLLILIKDVLLVAGASVLWKHDVVVQSEMAGKIATALFAAGCAAMLLIDDPNRVYVHLIFIPSAIMAVVSFLQYLVGFIRMWPTLEASPPDKEQTEPTSHHS